MAASTLFAALLAITLPGIGETLKYALWTACVGLFLVGGWLVVYGPKPQKETNHRDNFNNDGDAYVNNGENHGHIGPKNN